MKATTRVGGVGVGDGVGVAWTATGVHAAVRVMSALTINGNETAALLCRQPAKLYPERVGCCG